MYNKKEFENLMNKNDHNLLWEAFKKLESELRDKAAQVILHSSSIPCLVFHLGEYENHKELDRCMLNIAEIIKEYNDINQQFKGVLARITLRIENHEP